MTLPRLASALSPLFFTLEGAGIGLLAIYALEFFTSGARHVAVYVFMVGAAVVGSALAAATTSQLAGTRSRSALVSHLWHSSFAYVSLLYLLPPSFGADGAILFAFPASGLLGVILGNAFMNWRRHASARQVVP